MRRGSGPSKTHAATSGSRGGAGRIATCGTPSARTSRRGNQRPLAGRARSSAAHGPAGAIPASAQPRANRARWRSRPRTRPSSTRKDSAAAIVSATAGDCRAARRVANGEMPSTSLSAADRLARALVEGAMAAHHRRRLRNLGHERSYEPPADGTLWAAGDPPPRAGNAVDVLIDGAQALPEIARAIRSARRHVHIAGWSITPHFALTRDEPPVVLRELLADAAERVDVRVLMWAGAPPRTFAPDRRAVRAA